MEPNFEGQGVAIIANLPEKTTLNKLVDDYYNAVYAIEEFLRDSRPLRLFFEEDKKEIARGN